MMPWQADAEQYSLYFHIPYCERKCLYCDFYSIESHASLDKFLEALREEIILDSATRQRYPVSTIFFGGGTPSLLEPQALEAILATVRQHWDVEAQAEITVETNPGTVNRDKLTAYRSLGVNRLSVGIQSFDEEELKFLSRIHDAGQAVHCVDDARAAGFDNINIDLIYSLPGQSVAQWFKSLEKGLSLSPDHLSLYSLIVEDGTPLARFVGEGRITPNSGDAEADLYAATMARMHEAGYHHYEVSNYARPGKQCRHNLVYWHHRNYIGFGPSAHSFEKTFGSMARRWGNIANISSYLQKLSGHVKPIAFEEQLQTMPLVREAVFLGLRSDGLNVRRLHEEFGYTMNTGQQAVIEGLLEGGLLVVDADRYRLTDRGYLLCDEIACRLMP